MDAILQAQPQPKCESCGHGRPGASAYGDGILFDGLAIACGRDKEVYLEWTPKEAPAPAHEQKEAWLRGAIVNGEHGAYWHYPPVSEHGAMRKYLNTVNPSDLRTGKGEGAEWHIKKYHALSDEYAGLEAQRDVLSAERDKLAEELKKAHNLLRKYRMPNAVCSLDRLRTEAEKLLEGK